MEEAQSLERAMEQIGVVVTTMKAPTSAKDMYIVLGHITHTGRWTWLRWITKANALIVRMHPNMLTLSVSLVLPVSAMVEEVSPALVRF